MHTRCLVLPSIYRDSVVLMQLSHTLEGLPEVRQVAVMMGAPQNKALLHEAGLLTPEGERAGANDLLICVQTGDPAAAERVLQEVQQLLSQRVAGVDVAEERAPRTLETALRRFPEANLACISVPGQYAVHEARKAIQHGLHVFLFSDHVSVETEVELKQLASRHGVLVMGPDCGTSILNGVPLGFANQVSRGPVGLISASGTGLQQVVCLLARQGIGISQAIGVGGRDLHRRVGGHSMRAALHALADDAHTRVIVLISKPPETAVAARLMQEAACVGKPCVLAFLGNVSNPGTEALLHQVATLEEAALVAGALVRGEPAMPAPPELPAHGQHAVHVARALLQPGQQTIRAFYCGGTLAYEALWLLRRAVGHVASNLDGVIATSGDGHMVLDLGAEEFTRGRPHPMLDPTVRRQQLLRIATRPDVAVVLCDVILGWGAHADPAGALGAAWQEARELARADGRHLVGIATVCGTPGDPQGYTRQCEVLQDHDFILAESNAQAVRLAAAVVGDGVEGTKAMGRHAASGHPTPETCEIAVPQNLPALFTDGPRIINLGLAGFAEQLTACNVPVVHVDWRPPAGGNARLATLLERLR